AAGAGAGGAGDAAAVPDQRAGADVGRGGVDAAADGLLLLPAAAGDPDGRLVRALRGVERRPATVRAADAGGAVRGGGGGLPAGVADAAEARPAGAAVNQDRLTTESQRAQSRRGRQSKREGEAFSFFPLSCFRYFS